MDIPIFPEYQPSFQAWQIFYWLSLMLSTSILAGAILFDNYRRCRSVFKWLLIPGGLGFLYMWGFPWNVVIGWIVISIMNNLGAPFGSVILCISFTIFCWCLSFWSMFGEMIMKGVRHQDEFLRLKKTANLSKPSE